MYFAVYNTTGDLLTWFAKILVEGYFSFQLEIKGKPYVYIYKLYI